ncbi:MAG: GNAT family N-acetyltransferase [Bacteroidales bacterium]|nr:GNAT family N-acetyltransferase [Bacteroidales bacterium]
MIRKAEPRDLEAVNRLLQQVLSVHHQGRPDLFHEIGKKYTDAELLAIFGNPETPVFVYEQDGEVLGYVFCALQHAGSGSLKDITTLYIDDLCVERHARGGHIGTALFRHAQAYARELGCHNITLHVWACNPGARAFYESLGLKPQFTSMEMILPGVNS